MAAVSKLIIAEGGAEFREARTELAGTIEWNSRFTAYCSPRKKLKKLAGRTKVNHWSSRSGTPIFVVIVHGSPLLRAGLLPVKGLLASLSTL